MRARSTTALAIAVAALAAGATAVLTGAGTAGAAGAPAAAPAAPDRLTAPAGVGYVRLAHLSPDTPPVDVYVTAFSRPSYQLVLKGVGYGQVSPYQRMEPDLYTVAMRLAGAAPSSPAVLSATVRAGSGSAFTVAGLGKNAQLGLKVISDDLRLPGPNQARLRVIHAAAAIGPADVAVDGAEPVISNAPFAAVSSYVNVPAGQHTLKVYSGDGSKPPATLNTDLVANDVYSLIVLDQGGGVVLRTQVDAAAPGHVPAGAVETGAGGAAVDAATSPLGLILIIAALVLALIAAITWPRRRRDRESARSARHRAERQSLSAPRPVPSPVVASTGLLAGTPPAARRGDQPSHQLSEKALADVVPLPRWAPEEQPTGPASNVIPWAPAPRHGSLGDHTRLGLPRHQPAPYSNQAGSVAGASAAAAYSAKWAPGTPFNRGNRDPRRPRHLSVPGDATTTGPSGPER